MANQTNTLKTILATLAKEAGVETINPMLHGVIQRAFELGQENKENETQEMLGRFLAPKKAAPTATEAGGEVGVKKDGTVKKKPGRKPKAVEAEAEVAA